MQCEMRVPHGYGLFDGPADVIAVEDATTVLPCSMLRYGDLRLGR